MRLAPSTIAASSSSNGTPDTKPRSVQIVNGRTNTRYVSARPMTVFVSWRPSRMRNSEMISASAGIICTIRARSRGTRRRPRNRKRASATAARKATTSASATTMPVTIALFFNDVQKYSRSKHPAEVVERRVRRQERRRRRLMSSPWRNAVSTIQYTGNSATRATTTPAALTRRAGSGGRIGRLIGRSSSRSIERR